VTDTVKRQCCGFAVLQQFGSAVLQSCSAAVEKSAVVREIKKSQSGEGNDQTP
jgi:hypothetical protein